MADDNIMRFSSQEEMEAASQVGVEGAEEVVAALLAGRIEITEDEESVTEPVIDEVPEEQQETDEVILAPEKPEEEAVVEEEIPADDPELLFEEKLAAMREQSALETKKLQEKIEEQNRLLEEASKKEKEEPVVPVEKEIELDEEDIDLATGFEKNTRKLIEELKANAGNGLSQDLADKIAAIEERQVRAIKAEEEAAKAQKAANDRRILYEELDAASGKYKALKMPKPVGDMHSDQIELKNEIARALKIEDAGEIEASYRRVIRGDTNIGRNLRKKLSDAKVELPEGSTEYLNLIELHERQIGKKFDIHKRNYEPIVDKYGEVSRLTSIEDAYRLSNFNSLVTEAGKRESLEIQKRLEEQNNAAVTLDDDVVGSASGKEDISEQEAMALLEMDPSQIKANKDLSARYVQLCELYGIQVPPMLK